MAKIQTDRLKKIGDRYGALEANTGVPTVNLSEGVSIVHDVSQDLTANEGDYFYYTIQQGHVAAGTIRTTFDPFGALNIIGSWPRSSAGVVNRVDRSEEDVWLLSATMARIADSGQTLIDGSLGWVTGISAPALSSGTVGPSMILLDYWDSLVITGINGTEPALIDPTGSQLAPRQFPFYLDPMLGGLLEFQSTTGVAATSTYRFSARAWVGPRDVVPRFA